MNYIYSYFIIYRGGFFCTKQKKNLPQIVDIPVFLSCICICVIISFFFFSPGPSPPRLYCFCFFGGCFFLCFSSLDPVYGPVPLLRGSFLPFPLLVFFFFFPLHCEVMVFFSSFCMGGFLFGNWLNWLYYIETSSMRCFIISIFYFYYFILFYFIWSCQAVDEDQFQKSPTCAIGSPHQLQMEAVRILPSCSDPSLGLPFPPSSPPRPGFGTIPVGGRRRRDVLAQ